MAEIESEVRRDDAEVEGGETRESEEVDWKAEAEQWKSHARKWESRAKENFDAARKLKEIEDAKKTEQERVAEQLEAAKAEGEKASRALMRLEVALDKAPEGMPLSQVRKLAKRLTGATREELESDAEELFADFPPARESSASGRPRERLRPGATREAEPDLSPGELAKAVAERRGY